MPSLLVKINVDDKGNVAIEKLSKNVSRAQPKVHSLGQTMKHAFGVIGLYKGINFLIAKLNQATTESLKFEKALKKVQSIGNETNATMRQMGAEMERIALATEHSFSQIAEAQLGITKAGIRGAEGLAVLKHSLDLVTVSGEGYKETTEGLINILNAFQMGTEQSGYAANVMSRALNETILNLEEYLDAMKYSAPIAAQLGVSFEKLSAIIGILAQTGQRGSLAGTGMRNVLLNMLKVTPEVAESLRRLKFEEMGVVELLKSLHDHGVPVADLLTQFNKRGILAALAIGKNADAVQDLHSRLTDFERPLSLVASEMRDNLLDQLARVNNHFVMIFNTLNEHMGAGGKTVLDNFMDKMAEFNQMLKDNPEMLRDWTDALTALGKGLAELIPLMGLLIKHSRELIAIWAVTTLAGKLGGIITAFKGIKVAALASGTAGKSALLGMLNPITTVTAALAGLVVVLNNTHKKWKKWGEEIGEDIIAKQTGSQLKYLETLITLYEQTGVQGSYNKKLINELETNLADLGTEISWSASRQVKLNQAYAAYNELLGKASVKVEDLKEKETERAKAYGANLIIPKQDFGFDIEKFGVETDNILGKIFDIQSTLLKTKPTDIMLRLQGNLTDLAYPPDKEFHEGFKQKIQQTYQEGMDWATKFKVTVEQNLDENINKFNDYYNIFSTVHGSTMDLVAARRDFEHQQQMKMYDKEMVKLNERYKLEVKAAGNSTLQRTLIDNNYVTEKAKLEAKANEIKRRHAQKQWRADMLQIALNSPVMATNFISSLSKYMGAAAIPAGLALAAGVTATQLAAAAVSNPAQAFYTGGRIEGEGNSTSDSINARVSKGEWLLSRDDVERLGGDSAVARMITMGDNISNQNNSIYIDTIIGEEIYVRRNILPIIREEMKR